MPEPLQRSLNAREDSNVKAGEEEQKQTGTNPNLFRETGLRLWWDIFARPLSCPHWIYRIFPFSYHR